jgi:hypothetical protein
MARKSTPRAGAESTGGNVIDRTDVASTIPPTPSEPRPGSVFSLEMVNVFGEPVAESTGGTPGARLQLTAWVNNVSYLKDVWVDAYLTDASGGVAHREALLLDYHEGAGGGGDFFVLDAPIVAPTAARGRARGTSPQVTSLQYRLYYQIGDTVFAEGILHHMDLGTPAGSDLEITLTRSEPAGEKTPPALTPRASKVVAAGDGAPAKPTAKSSRATRKAADSTPDGSTESEGPPKRTLRRRPSA